MHAPPPRRRDSACLPYFWGVSRPAALNLRAFRAWPVPGQPHARARAPCMPAAWPADFRTRIRPAAFEPRPTAVRIHHACMKSYSTYVRRHDPPCMLERLPYRVMALHGGVIVGGDIYIRTTFNSAPLTSHGTMWERTIGPIVFIITQNLAHVTTLGR